MKLENYLWENRMTQTDFAEKLGYTRNYINMICKGRITPGNPIIRIIVRETEGKVTEEDLKNVRIG